MLRLFVAIELPLAVRDALLAAMGGVAGARWQGDEQLHLTLRFIGEVDRHRAADIAAALGAVNFQPFPLVLAETGTFDRRGRVDTLWVVVRPQDEVTALARRIFTGGTPDRLVGTIRERNSCHDQDARLCLISAASW